MTAPANHLTCGTSLASPEILLLISGAMHQEGEHQRTLLYSSPALRLVTATTDAQDAGPRVVAVFLQADDLGQLMGMTQACKLAQAGAGACQA